MIRLQNIACQCFLHFRIASPSVFNTSLGTMQMLMNGKSCLIPLLVHSELNELDQIASSHHTSFILEVFNCSEQVALHKYNRKHRLDVHTFILDFEKAFDTPPHELLKSKLFTYGIGGKTWVTLKCAKDSFSRKRKDNLSYLLVVLYHVILNANSTLRKHAYAIYYMGFAKRKKNTIKLVSTNVDQCY